MKKVAIVGGGILGCMTANELLESGCEVFLITELDGQILNVISEGVHINNRLIPQAIGGGGAVWSGLSSLISRTEWNEAAVNRFVGSEKYDQLFRNYSRASYYGFPSLQILSKFNVLNNHKLYYRSSRMYSFSELLHDRDNLHITRADVKGFKDNGKNIILSVYDGNKLYNIEVNKLILAAGGIGNYELLSKAISKFDMAEINLHLKSIVAKVKFTSKGLEYADAVRYYSDKGLVTYLGYVGGQSEHYLQVLPCKWYHNDSFVELLEIRNYLRISGLVGQHGLLNLLKIAVNFKELIRLIRVTFFSAGPLLVWLFYKVTNLDIKNDHARIVLHMTPNSGSISSMGDAILINQDINEQDVLSANALLDKYFLYLSSNKYIEKFKSSINPKKFVDSNHFMGTTVGYLDNLNNGYLSGRIKGFKNIYSIGTSNIWFKNNVNPTFLSMALAFFTIDEVIDGD